MRGFCGDCIFYRSGQEHGIFGSRSITYCSHFSDFSGDSPHYKKVGPSDSCNDFSAKSTPSSSDFRRGIGSSGSSCYLTSACVKYMGKEDDCYELTTLRAFRDNYMRSLSDGQQLVEEYYKTAPKIVEAIDNSGKEKEYYSYIYSVVCKCVKLIEENKNAEALEEYKQMVIKLQNIL